MTGNHEQEPQFVTIPMVLLIIAMLFALIFLNEKKLDKSALDHHEQQMREQYTEIQNDIRDIRNVLLIPRKP